ncbi:ly6/PLAUR domain-containing protein 3-like [Lissotriton helveticus]
MEEGKHAQVWRKVSLAGMLVAVLLAQGVASLRCFSCKDFNDGGCAADRIKMEECTAPRNICLEAITIVTIDKHNVSAAIKGCDIGIAYNGSYEEGLLSRSTRRVKVHTCSEDLCNTLVIEDYLEEPPLILPGDRPAFTQEDIDKYFYPNATVSSVPKDRECYSCISTSRNQCSTQNAAVVRCPDYAQVCYQGIGTIVLGHQNNITLPYFLKECTQSFCSGNYGTSSEYENHTRRGSCCHRNLCNDLELTLEPNGGPGAATYAAPLIVAALLAITSLL